VDAKKESSRKTTSIGFSSKGRPASWEGDPANGDGGLPPAKITLVAGGDDMLIGSLANRLN